MNTLQQQIEQEMTRIQTNAKRSSQLDTTRDQITDKINFKSFDSMLAPTYISQSPTNTRWMKGTLYKS